ncbi:unnamed protein product [Tuber melanosporum]|uniref:(Perigord truffle) hypothetical protein n=1 Tax=Tuber melanosporum (strain Mel28) TaxID=656061 RepID=D5GH68_TUBMM|nr:unnamed protein product [Tuber melanosporum]
MIFSSDATNVFSC